jgi:anti-anti-sigma factor
MSLAIKTRIVSDVVNIDMAGRLCFLEFALHEQINRLLDEGRTDFILNLADISYIDSFGLGQLNPSGLRSTKQGRPIDPPTADSANPEAVSDHKARYRIPNFPR